ncbi:carbamate kinase [Candidatus Aciduliprofundum boonei]|uniref:Carbamate kinase n=1 Tax=Aciduliprofundum boonei (strain DSM 19572 / T469) TaxID=439481 RepID=B5IFC2_ACIB4|nr:carbamate kinase [Candidatus Aciduliprofundum boonei]ADD07851.1 carbamate kinase [Aciduliprofundum boonei T469]EDY34988.1 carbamate kinase [Aciduliprofundum boonei T469]HII54955.1 carbamate kinase [Candidatus Aciduliprofundum boonei]
MKVVLAVGGNALLRPGDRGTAEEQMLRARQTAENIYPLFQKFKVVVTHGNGPQVGAILLQNETAKNVVPPMPLDICGAMSQGEIGYMLEQSFQNVLEEKGVNKDIATVLTRVIVDENDPAFENPTKPIGPFYTEEEAKRLAKEKGWHVIEDSGRGWRRVVPSPMPLEIVEKDVIAELLEKGFGVIAVGGGGIPVIRKGRKLFGVEGVIDKDLASAVLARDIGADRLIILTSVEKVYLNFGKPEQRGIDEMSVQEAKKYMEEGHFKKGSMYPKILASVLYLDNGGKEVLITSPEKVQDALDGKTGTWIYP